MERIFEKNTVNENQSVPRIIHEADMARMERTVHRLWISNIVMIILLFVTCAGFAYYESQFEDVTTTIDASQDGEGTNIVGGGDIKYGTEGKNNN